MWLELSLHCVHCVSTATFMKDPPNSIMAVNPLVTAEAQGVMDEVGVSTFLYSHRLLFQCAAISKLLLRPCHAMMYCNMLSIFIGVVWTIRSSSCSLGAVVTKPAPAKCVVACQVRWLPCTGHSGEIPCRTHAAFHALALFAHFCLSLQIQVV